MVLFNHGATRFGPDTHRQRPRHCVTIESLYWLREMSLRVTPLGPATLMCCELVGESCWCSVGVIGLGVAMVTAYINGLAVYLCEGGMRQTRYAPDSTHEPFTNGVRRGEEGGDGWSQLNKRKLTTKKKKR
jgi:hypothetical protein